MQNYNDVLNLVFKTIDDLNKSLSNEKILVKDESTVLFGKSSSLDSLELVNLIVSLEQNVEEEFNKQITLADENALSLENSPFKTVKSITEYVFSLINK